MNVKRIVSMLLAVVLVAGLAVGCQPQEQTSANATYKVAVVGPNGEPMANGVAVKFMQDGAQKAMQTVDASGVASKELPKGNYSVELMFTDPNAAYTYDKTAVALTDTKTELEIVLLNMVGEEAASLSVPISEPNEYGMRESAEYPAYYVSAGRTQVDLAAGDRNYYIFCPEKSGIYHITVEDSKGTIGYYGNPFVVQYSNIGAAVEDQENVISVKVAEGSVGAEHVIGIMAAADAASGVLSITRVGDVAPEIPFTVYQAKCELKPYVHPEGAEVEDFDLTKKYTLVLNENDGYYHLYTADGPLVLVRMGHNADASCTYMASVYTVAQNDSFYRYYFNEDGELTQKLGFMECLQKYLECEQAEDGGRGGKPLSYTYVDFKSGLYPLNEDLRYILQETGEQKGWWKENSPTYLFVDEFENVLDVDEESAWLFYCCYIAE